MKRILLLSLLLLPIVALAQYPTFSNKQKLGVQTTGDGLIFRGNSNPNYNPSNINNAYFYLDTTLSKLYLYNVGTWQLVYPTPQFDTTTLNVYLKISDTTAMLLPYFRDSDTTSLNLINRFALKLNISDTATMLTPYMKKADTISLSNRINLKLNISDTTILSNRITTNANNIITINNKLATKLDTIYVKFKNVVTMIENKDTINIGSSLTDGYAINIIGDSVNIDTVILDTRYPDRDSTNELQDITFATTSGIVTISGGKVMNLDTLYNSLIDSVNLLIRDSIAAFTPLTEGYGINIIGDSINIDTSIIFTQSDTITLSNRINTKLDTIYVNYQTSIDTIVNKDTINITTLEAGAGINITNNVISLDTVLLDSVVRVQNVYVKNGTGTVLNKGEAVYVTGANGTNIIVGRASNVAESSSSKTLGLTMTSIPIDGFGYVIKEGLLSGLNTSAADSAGVPIWLSNTPGGLIFGLTNKPYAPNHLVYLGVVTRKQQNNGEVYVTVQNGFEIKELHDVQIIDPVNKASLYYNSSQNLWRDTTATLLISDTASMLNPYLRKLDTISLSNRIDKKFNSVDTSILGYVTTYSNQLNINGNKTFNNTVSVDSLNATKQAKIQSLTVGKGGYTITGGTPGAISSTAFGFEALKNNTSGDWNTAIGYQALLNNDTAWNNVAIGNNSLNTNISGQYNTAIGVESLFSNKVGNNNVGIGYYAGTTSKGNNNIYIGNQTYHTDSVNNVLMIGGINTPLLSGIITGNKKLGINTNPLNLTNTFEVNSPISDAVKINSNTNSTNLELTNSNGTVSIKSSNKNMILQTDTTALVYLNGENNKVGILTMNPEQALEVNGTIRVDSLSNNLIPVKLVGGSNSNDLTNVELGTGLSFVNDTLKIADNIINSGDTATLLRKDYLNIDSNVLIWREGNKKLLPYFTQVYRNGQLLKYENQYTITNDSIVTLSVGNFRLKDNITIIAIDNITVLAGSGGVISLTGHISGSGTDNINTTINNGVVTNSMLAGSISDSKLNTITTAGKISNTATTATSSNTNNAIVTRDNSGNFSAGIITASLNGNANTVTTNANLTGDVTSIGNTTSIATGVIVNADINASAAIAVSKLAASTISGVTLGNNLNTLTISSPLTGTSYNGSSAVSIGIPAATGSINGYLTSTDWTTFNNKQNALTNPVTGTGTNNFIPKFTSTGSTIGSSTIQDNGTTVSTSSILSTTNYASFNTTQVMSNSSGILSTHRFTSANANGVYDKDFFLTSYMGAPWQGSDIGSGNRSKPPIVAIVNNNDPSFINSGLHMMTTNSTNNTYTPAITFGVNSENGSYYNTIGAITAKKLNTGNYTSQSAGQLEFFGTGTALDATGASMTTANMTLGVGVGIGYTTAPTVRGRLIVSEKLGINQSTPNFTLDVSGTANITGATNISNTLNATTGTFTGLNINNGGYSGSESGSFKIKGTLSPSKILEIGFNETNNFGVINVLQGGVSAFPLILNNSGGRVGIGTTTPSYLLDVNGTLGVTGATTLSSLNGTGTRMVTANSTGVLSTQAIPTGTINGSGTVNYIPKFTTSTTLGDANLFTNGNRFVQNEGSDQSFGWDKMGNTSSPFFGNNVKAGSGDERIQRTASTTLFNPSAIIFGFQRVNNSSGATSYGGINFMTTSGNPSGDINPIDYSRMFIQPNGNIGIGTMEPSYKFDIRGTLGVTGETTLSNTTSTTPNILLGKNTSTNVVANVTTVEQTGLMTRGVKTVTVSGATATFDVTHSLGVIPETIIITSDAINGSTGVFYEIILKTDTLFRVQGFNVSNGSPAINKTLSVNWLAIK